MIYAELTSEPRYRKNNFYRISLSTEDQLNKNLVEIGISPDGTDNNTTLLDFNRSEAKRFFKTALEIIQAIEEEENETDEEEQKGSNDMAFHEGYTLGFEDGMKEQKPAEWSEDWREEDIQTRFAFYTYKDDPSVLYLSNVFVEEASRNHGFGTRILKAAEKVAESIGAITICLKVKQDSPANAWYRKRGYGYVAFEDGYDWLEKNLEYMKPNKQEWSDEDEHRRKDAIYFLESAMRHYADTSEIEKTIAWLKSLRPSWKPSEEQKERSHFVIRVLSDGHMEKAILLYPDECDCKFGDVVKAIIRKKD